MKTSDFHNRMLGCSFFLVLLMIASQSEAQQNLTITFENTSSACQDGADNDGDGHIDCSDQDCEDFVFCAQPTTPEQTPQQVQAGPQVPTAPQVPVAPQVQVPAQPQRQIEVQSEPPGVRVAMDHRSGGVIFRTPHSFDVSHSAHSLVLDGPGLERLTVPIDAGPQNLLIETQMSRPVFEAGIALTIIGTALLAAGFAFLGIGINSANENRANYDPDYWLYDSREEYCRDEVGQSSCWNGEDRVKFSMFIAFGSSLFIPGILMLVLDKLRNPTYTISESPAQTSY